MRRIAAYEFRPIGRAREGAGRDYAPPTPSQAEGDREIVEADIREKEPEGKL